MSNMIALESKFYYLHKQSSSLHESWLGKEMWFWSLVYNQLL